MNARYFIDSNVLVYAGSQHPDDQSKKAIALDLLRKPGLGFSAQVMQEYFNVAYTKQKLGISLEVALENLELLARRSTVSVTPTLVLQATRIATRYQTSYWDAAILAAAAELGCTTLYSEDLSHGQLYGTVQVINPFI